MSGAPGNAAGLGDMLSSAFSTTTNISLAGDKSATDRPSRETTITTTTTNSYALLHLDAKSATLLWSTASVGFLLLVYQQWKQRQQGEGWWLTNTLFDLIGLGKGGTDASSKDSKSITVSMHRGSCQCGAITFKLTPPRTVQVLQDHDNLGKLQYPTARVPSDQLHLTSGKNLWNTYHLQSDDGDIWAFSFCKNCATQLLHATEADQSSLFVNVTCFESNASGINNQPKQSTGSGMPGDENSVGTKNSALTTVTALPNFADPRLFAQNSRQSSSIMSDGSDSAPLPPKKRSSKQKNRHYAQHQSSSSSRSRKQHLVTYVEDDADIIVDQVSPAVSSSRKKKQQPKSWNHPQREVLTYSRRVDAYAKMNARLNNSSAAQSPPIPRSVPSSFGQEQHHYGNESPRAPTAQ